MSREAFVWYAITGDENDYYATVLDRHSHVWAVSSQVLIKSALQIACGIQLKILFRFLNPIYSNGPPKEGLHKHLVVTHNSAFFTYSNFKSKTLPTPVHNSPLLVAQQISPDGTSLNG